MVGGQERASEREKERVCVRERERERERGREREKEGERGSGRDFPSVRQVAKSYLNPPIQSLAYILSTAKRWWTIRLRRQTWSRRWSPTS